MNGEMIDNLFREIEKLHSRNQLSKTIDSDYFEPGMMEYLDKSEGICNSSNGEILIRFESKGTKYDGRTEQIEKVNVGDQIQVIRDKGNQFNPNNFVLHTKKDQDVGNMPAELCNVIAPLFDNNMLTFESAEVSFVEPISKRSRYAKQAVLFVELKAKLTEDYIKNDDNNIKISSNSDEFPPDKMILPPVETSNCPQRHKPITLDPCLEKEIENEEIVRYAENVSESEKIPGLISYIQDLLHEISDYIRNLVPDASIMFEGMPNFCCRIPIILKKEKKFQKYNERDSFILNKINQKLSNRCGYLTNEELLQEIKEILARRVWHERILGTYFPNKIEPEREKNYFPFIEIYYCNFDCDEPNKYKAMMAQCLSHEIGHCINHRVAGDMFICGSRGFDIKVVNEAFADFFANMFLINRKTADNLYLDVARDRYQAWEDRFDSSWPYAGAKLFHKVDNIWHDFSENFEDYVNWGCIRKMFEFLTIYGNRGWRDAYKRLKE